MFLKVLLYSSLGVLMKTGLECERKTLNTIYPLELLIPVQIKIDI